jgi:hypothetical protein
MQPIVTVLRISGVAMISVGAALGAVVTPALFALVLLGVFDIVLAQAFASGRIGGAKVVDPAAQVEADPSFNPYARED